MPNSLKCRLKNLVRKGLLREKDLERIIIIPENATIGDMYRIIHPKARCIEYSSKVVDGYELDVDEKLSLFVPIAVWNKSYKR